VIAFNEVGLFAVQTLAVGRNLFDAAHAEIPKEIQHVVWLDALVHPIRDARIHLSRGRERPIAVSNDIEVPKMKIGREPGISHNLIMKQPIHKRPLCRARSKYPPAEPEALRLLALQRGLFATV
jgi:hypothetical protein